MGLNVSSFGKSDTEPEMATPSIKIAYYNHLTDKGSILGWNTVL